MDARGATFVERLTEIVLPSPILILSRFRSESPPFLERAVMATSRRGGATVGSVEAGFTTGSGDRREEDIVIEPERLRSVPLFGDLDSYDLAQVARWIEEVQARPGELLIEQGSMPYDLFVIEDGIVDVVKDGEPLATLGAGDVVGEIALLAQHRRMASVIARSPVRALALPVDALQELTAEMPELGDELRGLMERRRSQNAGE